MKIHVLQHVSFETPDHVEKWALAANHTVSKTFLFEEHTLPKPGDFDMLVIMGGPMGANDDTIYSWMSAEKVLIRQTINAGKKVLGICLGAQLIAAALGASVYPNSDKEIGWFPIFKCTSHLGDMALPDKMTVFHWHGDTFKLPDNAIHLFKSEGCTNQGFRYGTNVLALQFHLEMSLESINRLVVNFADELNEGKYVQTAQEILEKSSQIGEQNRSFLVELLNDFTLEVAHKAPTS